MKPVFGRTTDNISLKDYRKMKIKMLQRDFTVNMTAAEINHINELENEYAIDRYCRTLIFNRLDKIKN